MHVTKILIEHVDGAGVPINLYKIEKVTSNMLRFIRNGVYIDLSYDPETDKYFAKRYVPSKKVYKEYSGLSFLNLKTLFSVK